MHFHWQNLNDKPARRKGSPIIHGRAWWRFGDYGPRDAEIAIEWTLFRTTHCSFGIRVGGSENFGLGFNVGIPFLCWIFFKASGFRPVVWLARKLLPPQRSAATDWKVPNPTDDGDPEERKIDFSFHDGAFFWSIWRHPFAGWDSRQTKWYREGSGSPIRWLANKLLGKSKYTQRDLIGPVEAMIPMPEGSYRCTVRIYEATHKRPRWFARRYVRSEVEARPGVPFPGKGENSWDCGEDACYGSTANETTVEGAIAEFVEHVLRNRIRYGGSASWVPAQKNAVAS